MADKSFGVKELNLLNASGTPTVTSPNNLNLNANTVAISTSATVGNNLTVSGQINVGSNIKIGNAGVVTATTFSGSGASLTNLPAANITGTLPAISGANLTNLDASDLASGTVPDARFPATLPAVSGANLTGIAVTEAPVTDFTITANSNSAYRFAGGGVNSSSNNPDLYLVRGQKYRFNNTTGSSHPFAFRDSANGADYTSGISGSQNGIQFFTVPLDAPALLKYRCTIHTGNMVGNIYIRGAGGQETNVGFTTFSNKIEVQSSSNTTATFKGSGGAGFINITDGDDGTLAFLGVDGGTFKIQTSGGSYSDKLTVAPDGTTTFKNTSGGTLKVGGSSAHTSKIVIADNGGTSNGNCLVEGGDGTDFFTIQSNGNVAFTNGRGINFAATSDAGNSATMSNELFNDYEEGSWTPTGSWTTIVARYTKVGRMVFAGFSLRANASSGNVTIGGFPFTSASNHAASGGIAWGLCEFNSSNGWLNGSIGDGETSATIRRNNATVVTFGSGQNNLNSGAFIRGTFIYHTA